MVFIAGRWNTSIDLAGSLRAVISSHRMDLTTFLLTRANQWELE